MIRKLKLLVWRGAWRPHVVLLRLVESRSEDRIMGERSFPYSPGIHDGVEWYLYRLVEFKYVRENFDVGNGRYFGTILYLPGEGP